MPVGSILLKEFCENTILFIGLSYNSVQVNTHSSHPPTTILNRSERRRMAEVFLKVYLESIFFVYENKFLVFENKRGYDKTVNDSWAFV
jgi:hypothetical protein